MRTRSILAVFLLAAAMLLGPGPRSAAAKGGGECLPAARLPVTVLVRGQAGKPFQALQADSFIDAATGRTILPLRALVAALAPGTDSARWYEDLQTATFWYGGHSLSMRFPRGADRAYTALLDGTSHNLTAYLCDGRVWAAARSVAEAFSIDIQYYEDGVVLIDGAGKDPWHSLTYGSTSQCPGFPEQASAYLWSPIKSSRRAATQTACLLKA